MKIRGGLQMLCLAVLAMSFLSFAPTASHAVTYEYRYVGRHFTSFWYNDDEVFYNPFKPADSVSISIITSHPITASPNNLVSLEPYYGFSDYTIRMSNGYQTFNPFNDNWALDTRILALSPHGLPTAWDFFLMEDITTNGASVISSSSQYGDTTMTNGDWIKPDTNEPSVWLCSAYGDTGYWSLTITSVPEPSTLLLLGVGLPVIGALLHCQRKRAREGGNG